MNKFLRFIFCALAPDPLARPQIPNEMLLQPAYTSLEQQLAALEYYGLSLNAGVTLEDLLSAWSREDYEKRPYDALLFMLGSELEREPWGTPVCDSALSLDSECIEGQGSYVTIVRNLCRIAHLPDLISSLEDFVDVENESAWLRYRIDGEVRHHAVVVNEDWVDAKTVSAVMKDIERDGKRFYSMENGQASTWFYLDEGTAERLSELTHVVLTTSE
jgi:hypothetical protein